MKIVRLALCALAVMLAVSVTTSPAAQDAGGSAITLRAEDARLVTRARLVLEAVAGGANIGWWTSTAEEARWDLTVKRAGTYAVTAAVSCESGQAGSTVAVTAAGATLRFVMPDTGGWLTYRDAALGEIVLPAGTCPVTVKAVEVKNEFVGNLRSLVFTPVGTDAAAPGDAGLLAEAKQGVERYRKTAAALTFLDGQGKPLPGVRVQVRQTKHEFLFGCAAFELIWAPDGFNLPVWKERFRGLFNFAVFPFYWEAYEPAPGQTIRDSVQAGLDWCRDGSITAKGHPLVWTNAAGVPKWLAASTPEKSEALMLARVRRETAGYAGRIGFWDVVNEAVHCRTWKNTKQPDYAWESIPDTADYVDKAFREAAAADPTAHLILNDFNLISIAEERERFCSLVAELKRRGTPLAGLGIQAHEPHEEWFSPEKVRAALDRLASFGCALHITEFIPQSSGKAITGGYRTGVWTEDAQAEFAEQFYRLCFGHPSVVSITWWGLSDRNTWLAGGGLLDAHDRSKAVYKKLSDLIQREWKTSLDASTDARGSVSFTGFYGEYRFTVTLKNGRSRTYTAALRQGGASRLTFTVK